MTHLALPVQRFHADGATASNSIVADETISTRPRAFSEGEKAETDKSSPQYIEHATEPSAPAADINPTTALRVQDEQFEWREVWRGVFDVQTWLTALAYMAILISLYSLSLFL